MKERPRGGTGRAGALRPGQNRALLAGPEAHEGLGLVLTRARAFACIAPGGRSSVLALVCPSSRGAAVGKASPPRGAPPAQALAGNPSVLMKKRQRGQGADPGGGHAGGGCAPLGNSHSPWLRFQPQVCVLQIFWGAVGEPHRAPRAGGRQRSAPTTPPPPGSALPGVIPPYFFQNCRFVSPSFSTFPAQTCTESRRSIFSVAAFVHRKLQRLPSWRA